MYCKFCGNEISSDVKFCPKCGSINEEKTAPTIDSVFTETPVANPYVEEKKSSLASKALTFGIVSLVVAYFTGIWGLIFAGIARSNARKYGELNLGVVDGKAKVGRILATIATIMSIAMAVVYFFSIVVGVFIGLAESGVI